MGVKNLSSLLKDSTISSTIKLDNLDGKIIGFDAFNQLFQFLSSIRVDGQSMVDNAGNITSHLHGILLRGAGLIKRNIQPVYIFDGKSHEFKAEEQQKRRDARDLAQKEYEKAIAEGNEERAKMFAKRINRLTPEMVEDAKELLHLMGVPVVQAPGEGEAQAAQLTKERVIYATASQDYDTLMFGSPVLIRNLNLTGKRRNRDGSTKMVYPEKYMLNIVLNKLDLNQEQLIDLGILMGTDFNKGFPKVGPKTAYKFIKKYGSYYNTRDNEDKISSVEIPYEEIRDIFLIPNVEKNISVDFSKYFDLDGITQYLKDRNFDLGRYKNILNNTQKEIDKRIGQTSLEDWF